MMTSLLLLKIIYVLANFLILSDTLLFKYFLLYVYFKENLDFANNLNNMTLLWAGGRKDKDSLTFRPNLYINKQIINEILPSHQRRKLQNLYRVITLHMGITFLDNLICWALRHGGRTINGLSTSSISTRPWNVLHVFHRNCWKFPKRKSFLHEKQSNKQTNKQRHNFDMSLWFVVNLNRYKTVNTDRQIWYLSSDFSLVLYLLVL